MNCKDHEIKDHEVKDYEVKDYEVKDEVKDHEVKDHEVKNCEDECCICLNNREYIKKEYTFCPSEHRICKECFLRLLTLCYCRNSQGEILYTCPMCRNEKYYTNKEMHFILKKFGSSDLITSIHSVCKNEYQIPNLLRHNKFEVCGCRKHIKQIEIPSNMNEEFEKILKYFNVS